ncbi:MAG TPA: 4Fe-4S cluster-binding domain-containing protein [Caldithrix sp.]|nr:4Fe-4S cluster-binding domain-containing protein [Caldithrix sp.]
MIPVYLKTLKAGGFAEKIQAGKALLKKCRVCPRNCGVNRFAGETGECHTGSEVIVSSYFAHFGEEAPLVGRHGSGTIFIGGCNLQCVFCQNYEISHLLEGRTVSTKRLAEMMLELQDRSCHNINIVTPSHVVPQLIESIKIAAENGLKIPLVYNTSGYDSLVSLRLLDGIVDIYMPDFKFFSDQSASGYVAVKNYAEVAKKAIREMHRQVGDLVIEDGIALRGLLVRHLVMPGMVEDSRKIFHFLAREISPDTYLNVMPQYHPAGKAHLHAQIARRLYQTEYTQAVQAAREKGMHRLDTVFEQQL